MNTELLFELSPPTLLGGALYGLGVLLRKTPIPPWIIPFIVITLGGVIFPFIVEDGTVVFNSRHPEVYTALIGCCIGGFPLVAHQGVAGFMDRKRKPNSEMPNNADR